jgi:hypothetical protein
LGTTTYHLESKSLALFHGLGFYHRGEPLTKSANWSKMGKYLRKRGQSSTHRQGQLQVAQLPEEQAAQGLPPKDRPVVSPPVLLKAAKREIARFVLLLWHRGQGKRSSARLKARKASNLI